MKSKKTFKYKKYDIIPTDKPRMRYIKTLDYLFSIHVRLMKSSKGIANCCTCGVELPRKKLYNCHFISRTVYRYRRDIDNCNPWCRRCNVILHGNYIQYTLFMINNFWIKKVQEMLNNKQKYIISTKELINKITFYQKQLEDFI